MNRSLRTLTIAALLLLFMGAAAHAGFKLKDADGNEKIDLGFRLQVLGIATDRDLDGDGDFESFDDYRIRRARFRLKGTVNEHVGIFLQTDVAGNDVQMIDAYIHVKKNAKIQAFVGQHLVPSSRQTVTSSGALLAVDRPGLIYKALTWGDRTLSTFDTVTYGDSDSGIRGTSQVRDVGVTLFGVNTGENNKHFKWYLGAYDGVPAAGEDSQRLTGRFQFNFGDAEPSYYSTATYLGKKQTLAIGGSYDVQSDVAGTTATPMTDYAYWNLDVFAEQPVGAGSMTVEASYHAMDLDDANLQAQGDGFYVQAGYLINKAKWQPWVLYEEWSADASSGRGSYDLMRVGVSYFMQGHNANLKIGYEKFNADANIGSSLEDSIDSFVVGFFTTY